MSRRTLSPRAGEAGRRANRMAPGGRLYSESSFSSFNPSQGLPDSGLFAMSEAVLDDVRATDDAVAPGPYATLTLE